MRLFSIPSFRFALGNLEAAIGKWSRGATPGRKIKDGAEVNFNAETLTQMVENVAARGDKVAICQDHKSAYVATTGSPAPSLGYFYALAVFDNGRLVSHWSKDGGQPPTATDDDGKPRDGLYCRLGEITPLGYDSKEGLANFAALSPMFSDADKDEKGNDIGYALMDFGATSTPFQAGCEIQFHRGDRMPVRKFDSGTDPQTNGHKTAKCPACGQDVFTVADPAQWPPMAFVPHKTADGDGKDCPGSGKWSIQYFSKQTGAMSTMGAKMDPAMLKKLGLAEDAKPEEVMAAAMARLTKYEADEAAAKKMADDKAADDAKKMADDDKSKEKFADDEEDKKELSAMAKALGVAPKMAAIRAAVVPVSEFSKLQGEVRAMKDAQAAKDAAALDAQVGGLVARAISAGYPETQKDALTRYAKVDYVAAEALVKGHVGEKVFGRVTSGGAPVGAPRIVENAPNASGVVKMGRGLSDAIKAFRKSNPKVSYEDAAMEVARANPGLVEAYRTGN